MSRYRFSDPELEREYLALHITPPKAPDMHNNRRFKINYTFSVPSDARGGRVNHSESTYIDAPDSAAAQREFNAQFKDENPEADLRSVTCIPVGN